MHAVRAFVWVVTVALSGHALAQPVSSPLSVSRAPGADDCPDAEGLLAQIEAIRQGPSRADQPAYRIAFARDDAGLRAEIISEQSAASRVLSDASPACAALAKATAVTLALLFDADAQALAEAEAHPPAPVPVPAPIPREPEAAATDTEASPLARGISLGLGGGVLSGVVGSLAPALAVEASLRIDAFRAMAGFLFAPGPRHELGPGSVREQLAAASLHACLAPWRSASWRFDVCGAGVAGAVHGSARGFDESDEATRAWLGLGLDLRFASVPDPIGAELSAALLVPLRRQDFAVDNAGIAYEAQPLALLTTLRITLGTGL